MVTSQLATRTLPEKEPVEVSAHATPTVEIRSASDHLTAVAGLVSVSGAGSDRQWNEAPQCGDRSELRRKVIHRSGRPSGTVIRRVIDDDTLMTAITLAGEVDTDDLREILPALQEFTQAVANFLVAAGGDVEPAMQSLAEKAGTAEKLAIDMREDRGQHLTDGRSQTPLGRLRRLAEGVVRDVSRLIEAATVTAAAQQYTQQTEPATLAALGSGQAKHLMITPRPGTREALGAGQLYPDTVSTADRMQLALPASKSGAAPFTNLTLTGAQPPVLDVLAIGGGHGGVNATFEPDSLQESAFSKDYWKNTVVAPLAAKGVKADLIVLDACLTASMIDAFAPLCSAHGTIIASMYSINQKVMTPEIWAEVLGKASAERPAIIERRAQEVVRNADQASAAALFSKIKSAPSGDLEAALAIEPGLRNVVSGVRYLPKIVDAVQGYLRAKSQDRRAECLGDLDAIENATPAADPRDAQVASWAADMLRAGGMDDSAVDVIRVRLQEVTGSGSADLVTLRQLLGQSGVAAVTSSGAAEVPTQVAVYDHAAREIRFDRKFLESGPRAHVEASTGAQSAGEMRNLQRELEKIRVQLNVKLSPLAAEHVVAGPV